MFAGIKISLAMSHFVESFIFFMRNKTWNFLGNKIWIKKYDLYFYSMLIISWSKYTSSLFKKEKERVQGVSQLCYVIILKLTLCVTDYSMIHER